MSGLIQTTLEIALINAVTVLALFLSYSMLDICDLSTDGCFTLGASVGAVIALAGHPYVSILGAMVAGMCSGLILAVLQTKLGIDSLLSGIILNTALYSVNIAVMGNSSILNLNKTETVFVKLKAVLADSFLNGKQTLIIAAIAVILIAVFLSLFLATRLGLAIRATGNNMTMVKSSSINPDFTITIGLCISGAITALSGCLLAQSQKSVNIDIGSGMVTIALASLLIGRVLHHSGKTGFNVMAAITGSVIFRTIYSIALRLHMPAFMLKLISAVIVTIALAVPKLQRRKKAE